MNIDPRGKKRGRCLAEECDCELYEYEERSGPKCYYCSCPPTKHQVLDHSLSTVETISNGNSGVERNEDVINDTSQEVNYVVEVIESEPTASLSAPVLDAYSSQLQNLLPKKLPKKVESALTNKSLTPLLRNRIVRAIADKCFEESISSNAVNAVANLAVQKWSPLKNQCGESPGGTLATQIKRRMAKLRLNDKKKQNTSNDSSEIDEAENYNQLEMGNEMKKQYPSQLKLKQFLGGTRQKRKNDVNKMPALQVLGLYPALKITDLLLWEFTQLVNVAESTMVQRWNECIDAFKNYIIRTEGNCSFINESYESSTVEVLIKLPTILVSGKRTASKKKLVLEILEENATVAGNVPEKTDPPRIIAVGDPTSATTFFAYVDGCAIFTESCPIKSLLLLLAVYWVFNIEFCPEARPSFFFISSIILKNEMPPARTSKCGAVSCLIKQLSLK